jgi:heavy metal translocating P-type ATPase
MLKRVIHFLRDYKQFALATIAVSVALIFELTNLDSAADWVLIITSVLVAIPLAWDMVNTLRSGRFGIDVLALTAIITSLVLGEYWAAIIIVVMLTGGEALEDYAERRAKNELTTLLSYRPKKAHILRGNKRTDIKASEVQPGDRLVILPGEVVPVDATIIDGVTSIDESTITGESLPVTRQVNDNLLSGSINIDGEITVRAAHTAAESQYEQIVKLVRTATSGQSPFVRLADRYSVPFTALSFFIAGAAWFISGDAVRFLEVLVVATPCPLLLGAPIAIISGMSRASKHGVIIKTGSSLEQLAEVQTIAFDKTGTLTMGKPTVDSVQTYGTFKKSDVIEAAAALEQSSNHVLAQAIVQYAHDQKLKVPKAKHTKESAGYGLHGRVNGKDILVGHANLLEKHTVELPEKFDVTKTKQTISYIAIDGRLAGTISFKDEIRSESESMLARLRKTGVKQFALITGDNEAAAVTVAKKLNITDVYPDCLPGQKIQAIEEMPGPVVFVGDGVNDAPVLTSADVGIALGARGSTAASETADVVIMQDDVSKVATSVEVAKRTMRIAKQSVLIGIVISIGLMAAFATGRFTAVQGALIQELVDVIVIINALRAHGAMRNIQS